MTLAQELLEQPTHQTGEVIKAIMETTTRKTMLNWPTKSRNIKTVTSQQKEKLVSKISSARMVATSRILTTTSLAKELVKELMR